MTLPRHLKLFHFILPTLLLAIAFILPAIALAQSVPTPQQTQTWLEWILWGLVSGVFGGLTSLTGKLLDWTILELVLNFGTLFQTSGLGLAVNNLWSVVRDLFNLTFIFGLIYIGFQLILKADSSSARKAIVSLVIAAILVNFSLFFTKTVIDFSNILAVQISNIIYSSASSSQTPSISLKFAEQMGLSTIWDPSAGTQAANGGTSAPRTGYLYIFGAMIVFCIASFSFAAGAVLLFVRFIVLNLMMILSPVLLLGYVFTAFDSFSKKQLKNFLNQCFFAPAFLLMIYFSLYILGSFTSVIRNSSAASAALTNGVGIGGFSGLLLGAGFLMASVTIAQKMSATGVGVIDKFSSGAVNKIRGAVTGAGLMPVRGAIAGTARVGQGTIGMGASKLSNMKSVQNWAARNPTIGRVTRETMKKVADSSFDLRQVSGGKKLGLGEGSKGGYDTRIKDEVKSKEKFLDSLDKLDKGEVEARIAADGKVISTSAATKAATERFSAVQTQLNSEMNPVRQEIKQLNADMNSATDDVIKTQLATQLNAKNAALVNIRDSYKDRLDSLQTGVTTAQTAEKEARSSAEAAATFDRQLTYIQALEKSNETYKNIYRGAGMAIGGTAGFLTAGVFGAAGAGTVGGIVGQSFNAQGADVVKKLKDSYGADGRKKTDKNKRKDQLGLVADALKDSGSLPEEPKKP